MMQERLSGGRENPIEDRTARSFAVKGRLRTGVSRRTAQAELSISRGDQEQALKLYRRAAETLQDFRF